MPLTFTKRKQMIDYGTVLTIGIGILLILIIVVLAMALIMQISHNRHMDVVFGKMEDAFRNSAAAQRVQMEQGIIEDYYHLTMILFIKEVFNGQKYKEEDFRKDALFNLIHGWVLKKTNKPTLLNHQHARELATETIPLLLEFINTNAYNVSNDYTVMFDGPDNKNIWLSNSDFMKEVVKVLEHYDDGGKAFIKN